MVEQNQDYVQRNWAYSAQSNEMLRKLNAAKPVSKEQRISNLKAKIDGAF